MFEAVEIDWESECKCLTEKLNSQKAEFTYRIQSLVDHAADRDRIIASLQEELRIANAKIEILDLIFKK